MVLVILDWVITVKTVTPQLCGRGGMFDDRRHRESFDLLVCD